MFIFSHDGERIINSNRVTGFIIREGLEEYYIEADDYVIASYTIKEDAKKTLEDIIRQIEAGATRYDVR